MIFAEPAWLWALLTLPLLAGAELRATSSDRERTARLVARALWPRVVRRPAERWRWVRLTLLIVGTASLVVALARPQWGIVREKVEREGVDVVVALDTSGSMATEDVAPNRFFLARAALLSLIARLEGDRFGLLAFEGDAYPLVPLTLDADAVGLFLDTVEPGTVPAPGSSLGAGLAKGLEMFVDRERRNKVLVLVSDGEDLEGDVDEAVKKAKAAGVVVHTVGVGSEQGQPVPDFDREGSRVGFKKDDQGSAVVSRLHAETLEAMARGTGGRFFRLTAADPSLGPLAGAIEGMEQRSLAREYSYRKKERFQVPLATSLACLSLGLLVPFPDLRRTGKGIARKAAVFVSLLFLSPMSVHAAGSKVVDEILLRPRRLTAAGQKQYEMGNHPNALKAFESALSTRPDDPKARFNLADALYKNGKYDEAQAIYRALGGDGRSPLALPSRFNLGNALFQKHDYAGAAGAYRDALRLAPEDGEAKRNLELALRELQKQKDEQENKEKQQQKKQDDQKQDQQKQDQQGQKQDQRQQKQDPQKQDENQPPKPDGPKPQANPKPKTEEEKQQERFQKEAGMPKERAMQLLDALQQDEKAEQKRLLAARPATKRRRKDW